MNLGKLLLILGGKILCECQQKDKKFEINKKEIYITGSPETIDIFTEKNENAEVLF